MDPKCQKSMRFVILLHSSLFFASFHECCGVGGRSDGDVCQQIVLNSHFPQKFSTECTLTFGWNIMEMQDMKQQSTLFYCCQVCLSFAVCLSFLMEKNETNFSRTNTHTQHSSRVWTDLALKRVLYRSLTSIPPKKNNQLEQKREWKNWYHSA